MFHSVVEKDTSALGVDAVVRAVQVADDGLWQVGRREGHGVLLDDARRQLQQAGRVVRHVAHEPHHQWVVAEAQLRQAPEGDDLRGQGAQPVLVQQQRLEVLEVGDGGGQRLELVVAQHQHLQPGELAQGLRHLGQPVARHAQHGQPADPAHVRRDGVDLVAAQVQVLEAGHVQQLRREVGQVVAAQVELLDGGAEGLGQRVAAQAVVARDEGGERAGGQRLREPLQPVAAHVQHPQVGEPGGGAVRHGPQPVVAQDEVLDVLAGVRVAVQAVTQPALRLRLVEALLDRRTWWRCSAKAGKGPIGPVMQVPWMDPRRGQHLNSSGVTSTGRKNASMFWEWINNWKRRGWRSSFSEMPLML